jgi:hypothetical protein
MTKIFAYFGKICSFAHPKMKQKNHISCIAIVLCLFWLVGTIGYAFASKQSFEPQKDKSQTEVSAYQTKAVVPLTNSAVLCPTYFLIFEVLFLICDSANQFFQKPVFKIPFFEKIFEHLIAPQAP